MKLKITLEYEVPDQGTTKWDVLEAQLAALNGAASRISGDFAWMERTQFSGGSCSCGEPLPTEAAFAQHFTIPQHNLFWGYFNLGDCPNDKEA